MTKTEMLDTIRDDLLDKIRVMTLKGLSSTEIGVHLNKTRNAIIGLCHRNGIKLLRKNGVQIRDNKIIRKRPSAPNIHISDSVAAKAAEPKMTRRQRAQLVELDLQPKVSPRSIAKPGCLIDQLDHTICHWPLWGDKIQKVQQMFFCGAITDAGPYCYQHFQQSSRR